MFCYLYYILVMFNTVSMFPMPAVSLLLKFLVALCSSLHHAVLFGKFHLNWLFEILVIMTLSYFLWMDAGEMKNNTCLQS